MRDIQFRGLCKKDGKWYFGDFVTVYTKCRSKFTYSLRKNYYIVNVLANGGMLYIGARHLCFENTICQYTGLNDQHGVYIFEGDIVKLETEWKLTDGITQPKYETIEVKFENGKFNISDFAELTSRMEVIGNIFNNDGTRK